MSDVANRYASIDLFLPKEFHDRIDDYVARGENHTKPFSRQVDMWWTAIGIGVQIGRRTPLAHRKQLVKFNDGSILGSDPWRITHLELLALAEEGDEILTDPNRVVQIASEYAVTGLPWLFERMLGAAEPCLALLNHLEEFQSR